MSTLGARRSRTQWGGAVALSAAALLAGCGIAPLSDDGPLATPANRFAREVEMNHAWADRTLDELLNTLGAPWRLYDIPGGGNPPGFVVVYPRDPASGCIDAFAMVYGPQTRVRAYLCR